MEGKSGKILESFLLIFAQRCSIGFKSGEYGGRKSNLHPACLIILLVAFVLCMEALSMITVCPGFRHGTNIFSNQKLNKFASQVP